MRTRIGPCPTGAPPPRTQGLIFRPNLRYACVMRTLYTLALLIALTAGVGSTAAAQATMTRNLVSMGGGRYTYEFRLEIVGPMVPQIGWLIFGDNGISAPVGAITLDNPLMDGPVPGPWTSLSSSGGGHAGPTFAYVLDLWVPSGVGDALVWRTSATNLVDCATPLYWSNLAGTGTFADYATIACSTPTTCGDGTLDVGEQCDDGNMDDTDACTNRCRNAVCGDSIVRYGIEACDDGNTDNTDSCLSFCASASCGDGFVFAVVEDCDDGNLDDTDACLTDCSAASCGDGFLRAGFEDCDDGNTDDTDMCVGRCTLAVCGDGFVLAGTEECDDADNDESDACLGDCTSASCGDGFVQTGVEACDDGNMVDDDACNNMCMGAPCGDGIVNGTEECDDMNDDDTDACLSTCAAAACGDGYVQTGVEGCDDGNTDSGDGCGATCATEVPGTDGGMMGGDGGMMGSDGGVIPGVDAGGRPPPVDGGCGCRVESRNEGERGLGLLFALGALAFWPRRRRESDRFS